MCSGQNSALTVFFDHLRLNDSMQGLPLKLDLLGLARLASKPRNCLSPHPGSGITGSHCLCGAFPTGAEGPAPMTALVWHQLL